MLIDLNEDTLADLVNQNNKGVSVDLKISYWNIHFCISWCWKLWVEKIS
jgi:hypothetical protein